MKEHLKMIVSWFLVPWQDNPHVFMHMCDATTVYKQDLLLIALHRIEAEWLFNCSY